MMLMTSDDSSASTRVYESDSCTVIARYYAPQTARVSMQLYLSNLPDPYVADSHRERGISSARYQWIGDLCQSMCRH